jgi:signal transduction histidine kinase
VVAQREDLPAGDAHTIRVTTQADQAQEPEQPILLWVEQPRIKQIITNLLENAIKYSPDGGEILVTIGTAGSFATVEVSDQGIGIPESDLPNLFTPFYRSSNASSRHFTGLGLGLYLSQQVAEAHGGWLSVTSVEGKGATFALTLPLAADDETVTSVDMERT